MNIDKLPRPDNNLPLSIEDQIIRSREETGMIDDVTAQSKYLHERNELLLEPEIIGMSVKSIFSKYANKVFFKDSEGYYTPEIIVADMNNDNQADPVVFISHIPGSPEFFGVVKKAGQDNGIDLPWYLVGSQDGKTTIYGDNFEPISEMSDLAKFRGLLDYMKDNYADKVRQQADVLNQGQHINIGYNTLAIPDKITYYISGNHAIDYQPVDLDYEVPSLSLEAAVNSFFCQYNNDAPSSHHESQLILDRAEVSYKGIQIPIQTQHLQPLFQELTTFDGEEETLQDFRRQYLNRTTAN